MMSEADGGELQEESKDDPYAHLKMDTFEAETFMAKSTALFSTYEPNVILAKIADALQTIDSEGKRDDKKWKMQFQAAKKQSEEEIKNNVQSDSCKVTCKLLRVDDEKICIEFNRAMGSSWFFFETIKQLKEQLKDIDDATL